MHFIKADEAHRHPSIKKTALDAETMAKLESLADLFPENKELFAQFSKNLANHLYMQDLLVPHEFLLKFQFAVEEMREGKDIITLKPLPNEFAGREHSFYLVLFEGLKKIADALLDKETAREAIRVFSFIKNQMMFS
jgi:hypothetical protein